MVLHSYSAGASLRIAASAGIVTWVATGGNPTAWLGIGGERSLKRPDMAEKEARHMSNMVLSSD